MSYPRTLVSGPLHARAARARRRIPALDDLHPFTLVFSVVRHVLPKGHRCYRTRSGRLYVDIAEAPTMLARVLRMYEPEKLKALEALIRPGMTFIDIGACKGDFAVLAARLVGPAGTVVAVEPEPANAEWLHRSVVRNGLANVRVHRLALSSESGTAILHQADPAAATEVSTGWNSLTSGHIAERGQLEVETQTLDKLAEHERLDRVDVVKIDVEGWELPVLQGATKTLLRNPRIVLLMDIHPYLGVDPLAVADYLQSHGFATYSMGEARDRLSVGPSTTEVLARRPQ